MSDYEQTRDAAGSVTSQYSQMLQNLNDDEGKLGYLVITDTVEHEDGSATYKFDLDDKTQKIVAELGLRLTLTCAAYGMDIEDALQAVVDRGEYLSQEETE